MFLSLEYPNCFFSLNLKLFAKRFSLLVLSSVEAKMRKKSRATHRPVADPLYGVGYLPPFPLLHWPAGDSLDQWFWTIFL